MLASEAQRETAQEGRRIGTAASPAEIAVEEAIARVETWEARTVRYRPEHGGLQNSNWRISVEGDPRSYFLKVPGAGTDSFIDRANANAAAARAGAAGISPEIVAFFPDTGIEIVEFLSGHRACTNGDLKDPAVSGQAIDLYRAFHRVEALPQTKTMFDLIDEHLEQARELGVVLPADCLALLREYGAVREAFTASGFDLVPCHNDPMPGNFLVSDTEPMKLIDFEFSSNNERAYDVALMVTELFFDEPRTLECIEAFYGSVTWERTARVQVCSVLADLKWGIWGCVNQRLNSSWDFDYEKYGTWKLMRARAKMADPRWPLWLAAI